MTKQQSVKRRIRARMAETGERYTTARLHLVGRPDEGAPDVPGAHTPAAPPALAPDPRVLERTGRDWPEWYALLAAWGAVDRPHPEIARWLHHDHGVDAWWSQELTVRFERASGRRQPGQHADGFTISVTRTIGVPVAHLWEACLDEDRRARWLPDLPLAVRRATPFRTARLAVGAGPDRLLLSFTAKGDARASVTVTHERLADAGAAGRAKADWVARLDALRAALEG